MFVCCLGDYTQTEPPPPPHTHTQHTQTGKKLKQQQNSSHPFASVKLQNSPGLVKVNGIEYVVKSVERGQRVLRRKPEMK